MKDKVWRARFFLNKLGNMLVSKRPKSLSKTYGLTADESCRVCVGANRFSGDLLLRPETAFMPIELDHFSVERNDPVLAVEELRLEVSTVAN